MQDEVNEKTMAWYGERNALWSVHLQKKEEHDSLRLSCGAGENADDGGDGSDSSSGVYHV